MTQCLHRHGADIHEPQRMKNRIIIVILHPFFIIPNSVIRSAGVYFARFASTSHWTLIPRGNLEPPVDLNVPVFGLWENTGEPGGHLDSTQKGPRPDHNTDQRPSCCGATVLTTELLWPFVIISSKGPFSKHTQHLSTLLKHWTLLSCFISGSDS